MRSTACCCICPIFTALPKSRSSANNENQTQKVNPLLLEQNVPVRPSRCHLVVTNMLQYMETAIYHGIYRKIPVFLIHSDILVTSIAFRNKCCPESCCSFPCLSWWVITLIAGLGTFEIIYITTMKLYF